MHIDKYVPILKGKSNDLQAWALLSPGAKMQTKPLIELMPTPKNVDVVAHLQQFLNRINKFISADSIFVDLYGLLPREKFPNGVDATIEGFGALVGAGIQATPTYGFGRNDSIWNQLKAVAERFNSGFCFRIDVDDLDDQAEETWVQILQRSAELAVPPARVDLIIDLRYLGDADITQIRQLVSQFLKMKPSGLAFRSITVAGSSALKNVTSVPINGNLSIDRSELRAWAQAYSMAQFGVTSFGDYGVIHPDFSDGGPNKYINAKIRYTSESHIQYFRGHGLLHPVKDYEQYRNLAQSVMQSGLYVGANFSAGDQCISDVSQGVGKTGSPGTWVRADMNHHIEYTAHQIVRLGAKVQNGVLDRETAMLLA